MARRPFDPAERGWKKVSYRRGDVLDKRKVARLVEEADVVVHLAFMIMGSARASRRVNLDGSRNVFEAARRPASNDSSTRPRSPRTASTGTTPSR